MRHRREAVLSVCPGHLGRAMAHAWASLRPPPLGPLLDVAETTGGRLQELVEPGARPNEVASSLLAELPVGSPTLRLRVVNPGIYR